MSKQRHGQRDCRRYCWPKRQYLAIATVLMWAAVPLRAADPDFTIFVLPDTQYMAFSCSPMVMNVMMNWIVANKNASQGGVFTTNLKAVIGLGDVTQQASNGEFLRAGGNVTDGFSILDGNQIPFVAPPWNHDY